MGIRKVERCQGFVRVEWIFGDAHKNNEDFTTSTVMFLPFIHHPASNKDTIYTTLDCAVRSAKSHGKNCCTITFDQSLYYKAREIVAAADIHSDISNVTLRLGGFHMLVFSGNYKIYNGRKWTEGSS